MLRQALNVFGQFMTKSVFETDFFDYRIPLAEKMGEETHIFFILGPQFVKTGRITAVPPKGSTTLSRFIIEDATVLQENTITDPKQLLEWAMKHPKFKQIEDTQKVRRYLLGYMSESMDAVPCVVSNTAPTAEESSLTRISLPSLGDKPATPENVVPVLAHELYFNQDEFVARHSVSASNTDSQLVLDPNVRYGFLPVASMNRYLLCGERIDAIKTLMEAFQARGLVVRLSSLPLNAIKEALTDGIIEDKQQGLVYIYGNRTLVVFGWNKAVPGHVFLRYRRTAEEKTYKSTLKASFLGSAIIESASAWQKACHIRSITNTGIYFREMPGPSELILERTLLEVFTQAKDSMFPLELRAMHTKAKDTTLLPADLDVFTLAAE